MAEPTTQFSAEQMQAFSQAVGYAESSIRSRLADLDNEVGTLLSGWNGVAGGAYAAVWTQWHRGAQEVLDGLKELDRAVALSGRSFDAGETGSAEGFKEIRNA